MVKSALPLLQEGLFAQRHGERAAPSISGSNDPNGGLRLMSVAVCTAFLEQGVEIFGQDSLVIPKTDKSSQ